MPLAVVCGGCKRKLRIPDAMLGKTVQCPQCARKFKVAGKAKGDEKQTVGAGASGKTTQQTGAATARKQAAAPPVANAAANAPPAPAATATARGNGPAAARTAAAAAPVTAAPVTAAPRPTSPVTPASKRLAPTPRPMLPPRKETKDQKQNKNILIFAGLGLVLALGAVWFFFLRGSNFAQVEGRVTLDGEPLAGATIVFEPDLDKAPSDGKSVARRPPMQADPTDEDGRYKLRGHTSAGVPVGKYKVLISKMVSKKAQAVDPENEQLIEDGRLRNVLPAIHGDPEKTPHHANVVSGAGKYDFDIKTKQ